MKEKKYSSPYRAFPIEMHGNFAQTIENDTKRFIEIYSIPYSRNTKTTLERRGILHESTLWKYLRNLSIPQEDEDSVYFLYKLATYNSSCESDDPESFNESIKNYQEIYFYNIDSLLDFIKKNWGLGINNFTSSDQAGLPF